MLIIGYRRHCAFAGRRHLERRDLAREEAFAFRDCVFLLRSEREFVGLIALDVVLAGEVVGSLRHLVIAKAFDKLGVRETRPYRAVVDAHVTSEWVFAFAEYERRTAHAFGAADEKHITLACGDRVCGVDERSES